MMHHSHFWTGVPWQSLISIRKWTFIVVEYYLFWNKLGFARDVVLAEIVVLFIIYSWIDYFCSIIITIYLHLQWGSWNNSLNWRKVFKCLYFIWQTLYLKYTLFASCFCPWVFWLLWKPKLFFRTFITTRISIF